MKNDNLSLIMENYFKSGKTTLNNNNNKSIVKVKIDSWNKSKNAMIKKYSFDLDRKTEAFIVEILKYKRDSECDIQFSCRKNTVKVCIHSLSPYITEIELECSKDLDKIKKDVSYYYASKE